MFILAPAKQQHGGKSDTQNSFVLFDGQSIVLSKSIRRISTTWRSHLAHYLHCKRYSWQFKSGFGARILPTMKRAIPQSASFEVPLAPIESSKLHDPDAEAVIEFAEQEKKTEEEQRAMRSSSSNNNCRTNQQFLRMTSSPVMDQLWFTIQKLQVQLLCKVIRA